MQLAMIKSRAAAVLLLHMHLTGGREVPDSVLCKELGLSRQSLWRARLELRDIDLTAPAPLVDEPAFAPDDEEDALDNEADRIDAMDGSGKIGAKRTPAKDKRLMTVNFFAKAWKQLLPEQEPLKRRQVDEIVLVSEQNQEAGIKPAALLLKVIRILADRKPKQLTVSYIKTIVRGEGNGEQRFQPRPPRQDWQQKTAWQPKPGEAATVEEAAAARAAAARAEVEKIRATTRGAKPRKIGMIDDEEE